MAEYIEREAAIDAVFGAMADGRAVFPALNNLPAADVRPVVFCRDCKHNMANIPDIQDGININENWARAAVRSQKRQEDEHTLDVLHEV